MQLDSWERGKGHQIKWEEEFVYIENYEKTTISILNNLLKI